MVRTEGLEIPYSTGYYKDTPVRFVSAVGPLEAYEVEGPDEVVTGYRDAADESQPGDDSPHEQDRKLGAGSLHHALHSSENA